MQDKTNVTGLTTEEVQSRLDQGLSNQIDDHTSVSIKQIVYRNAFTLFNFLNIALALLVLLTKEYRNMLFLGVVFSNLLIGIFQEIRAKKMIDRLKLINDPYFIAIRDQKEVKLHMQAIVLDDLLCIKAGQQIPADCILVDGHLEVNESLLTGESNVITKKHRDQLYSGSYCVAGNGQVKVIHVGQDNYIQTILKEAKSNKKQPSMLKDALNIIIKSVTILIIPVGLLLFLKQYFVSNAGLNDSILATVAALIGMIPEGLVLLTSVTLALGAVTLIRKNTLTQELYSLETLARVNMLCLDKTGTLTEGNMVVETIVTLDDQFDLNNILANLMTDLKDDNSTAKALAAHCKITNKKTAITSIPFSSDRKHSAVSYDDGSFMIGAIDFLKCTENNQDLAQIKVETTRGKRVLAIAYNSLVITDSIPSDNRLIGYVLLADPIRSNAKTTLDFFDKQGVFVKIISGDDASTVQYIASHAGVQNADLAIDCFNKSDEEIQTLILTHNVFGRVSPTQKKLMIDTLKTQGYITAMVGDGVNDVMALKSADCSIAMKDGSDAAKNTANLILLDNDFANMPEIVNQGRRVINNIQRTATLFLTKTVFSLLLSFLTIFMLDYYPFLPIQLTLISTFCIGIPAFFLSLEPNYSRVEGDFLTNIFTKAIPSGLSIVIAILLFKVVEVYFVLSPEVLRTMIMICTTLILYTVLLSLTKKLNLFRLSLLLFIGLGLIVCFVFLKDIFLIETLSFQQLSITLIIFCFAYISLALFDRLHLSKLFTYFLKKFR